MSADHDRLMQLREEDYITLAKPYSVKTILNVISNFDVKIIKASDSSQKIHKVSLKDKLQSLERALQDNDPIAVESVLHQIKTTFGYLDQWEEIKQIQKIENTYSVHKNTVALFANAAQTYKRWKRFYSN
jgi:hypothetical protein